MKTKTSKRVLKDMSICTKEDNWEIKNYSLFRLVYSAMKPEDVPGWFNDAFLDITDTMLYECEQDDVPELLIDVHDYTNKVSRQK